MSGNSHDAYPQAVRVVRRKRCEVSNMSTRYYTSSPIYGLLSWLLVLLFVLSRSERRVSALRYAQDTGDENCETLKSEIHLIKEEFDELGRMQRTCNADVIVNKCEGLCNSQVQPSVITPTGFLKVRLGGVSVRVCVRA